MSWDQPAYRYVLPINSWLPYAPDSMPRSYIHTLLQPVIFLRGMLLLLSCEKKKKKKKDDANGAVVFLQFLPAHR